MIFDSLDNLAQYKGVRALDVVAKHIDFARTCQVGKYPIDEGFFLVQEYQGKEDCDALCEIHEKYTDVQIICENSEKIGVVIERDKLNVVDGEKDIVKFRVSDETITLKQGEFAVFFPREIHRPCIKINESPIKKIVFKVF